MPVTTTAILRKSRLALLAVLVFPNLEKKICKTKNFTSLTCLLAVIHFGCVNNNNKEREDQKLDNKIM